MTYPLNDAGATTELSPLPATIIAPRSGNLTIRHYWGSTARPHFDLGYVVLPARHAQEITNGDRAEPWPGDEVVIDVEEGEEILVGINGCSGPVGTEPANAGPTYLNTGQNARVFESPIHRGEWTRYVQWEDLVLSAARANRHYNDSRTLLFYDVPGWKIGRL